MLPVASFFALLLGSWSIFHLLYNFLLSCDAIKDTFENFLQSNHISVTLFNIRWFTTRWNRHFLQISKNWKLDMWFNTGVLFGFVAMLTSVVLLIHTLLKSVIGLLPLKADEKMESSQVLRVIVPGVNLPVDDIFYLISTVLLAGILHELGHAIAAAREGVQVNGFGVFFFLLYPGAYVDLNSDDLSRCSSLKQLRIYCAGVWHNFILCLISSLLIFGLPWIICPLYTNGRVIVTHQAKVSPLLGEKGLQDGDEIEKIGSCFVSNINSWYNCINKTSHLPQTGSCVPLLELQRLDTVNKSWRPNDQNHVSNSYCCNKAYSKTHLCYMYYMPIHKKSSAEPPSSFACLPGRALMLNKDCLTNDNCFSSKSSSLKKHSICATPYIDDTGIRFTRIVVGRQGSYYHVLYYGDPKDLARFVAVSDYNPRLSFLPLRLPEMLLKFFQYLFSMSGALALMNIVPCYALDGQWAFLAFVDYKYGDGDGSKFRDQVCSVVLKLGTLLVALNVLFGSLYVFWK